MEPRRPPDLEVVDVLRGRVDAHLVCDPLERGLGLHERDRIVEVRDVRRLAGAIFRRDHPETAAAGQLARGGHADGTVEVSVELGLLPAEESRARCRYVRA